MHEASLALSLVELAQETLTRHGLRRVLALHVEMGALAMVDAEALALAFHSAKQNTPCEQAQLLLSHSPALTSCPNCLNLVSIQHHSQPCPNCGLYDGWQQVGDTLLLKTLEAE